MADSKKNKYMTQEEKQSKSDFKEVDKNTNANREQADLSRKEVAASKQEQLDKQEK